MDINDSPAESSSDSASQVPKTWNLLLVRGTTFSIERTLFPSPMLLLGVLLPSVLPLPIDHQRSPLVLLWGSIPMGSPSDSLLLRLSEAFLPGMPSPCGPILHSTGIFLLPTSCFSRLERCVDAHWHQYPWRWGLVAGIVAVVVEVVATQVAVLEAAQIGRWGCGE